MQIVYTPTYPNDIKMLVSIKASQQMIFIQKVYFDSPSVVVHDMYEVSISLRLFVEMVDMPRVNDIPAVSFF